MASKSNSDFERYIVAAIDFGTTYSGWAYSFYHDFKTEPTKAGVKQWHSGSGILTTEKTPTVVLIKPDGKTLEAFGYDAENRYKELIDEKQHAGYYYFRRFKMKLYKSLTQTINRNFMLEDERGKTLPALDVFTMAIKYLVDDLLDVVNKRLIGDINKSEINFVLTVPAIWTDHAKRFMREAAEKAGIYRHKLSIALEPEAASAYCRHLPMDKTKTRTDVDIHSLPPGTKYIILDAGGGTIDITVHEVTDNLRVKEVLAASGGDWGGTVIDNAFEVLVQDIVGTNTYREFKNEEIEDWIELMREFEVKKKTIYPDKEGRVMMKFPVSLCDISEQKNGCPLNKYIENSFKYANDVEFERDKIKFKASIFKRLFEESCGKLVDHLKSIWQNPELGDLNLMLMVGGYSESPMLQEAVRKAFPTLRIVIPSEASTVILRGALICGHCPEFISHRVLKYTYGFEVKVPFIKGKHPESRKIKNDLGYQCDNVFDKHVEKGQIVKVGEAQVERQYFPGFNNACCIMSNIYASELQNPEFVDVDCTKIGYYIIDVAGGNLDTGIKVCLTFSGSEIEVAVVVVKTGEKKTISVNFLG